MISKRKWELLQEELYLQRTGTWAYVSDLMDRLQLTRQKIRKHTRSNFYV